MWLGKSGFTCEVRKGSNVVIARITRFGDWKGTAWRIILELGRV